MSQLASFVQLPVAAVQLLIPAAMRRTTKWFGFRKGDSLFQDYLNEHGTDLGCFKGDGLYIVVALLYLRAYTAVDLFESDRGLALMAKSLTKHLDTFCVFFNDEDRIHSAAILATVLDSSNLKNLCIAEGLDSEMVGDLGTFKAALELIASLLVALPDEHVVFAWVG
jgi:hypothetical protein